MTGYRRSLPRRLAPIAGGLLLTALVWALPDLARPSPTADQGIVAAFRGRIVEIRERDPEDAPVTAPVPIAVVTALDGPRAGETFDAYLSGPGGSQSIAGYRPGDEVVVTVTKGAGTEEFVAVSDRWRLPALQILAGAFALAVLLVGGWHGARALIALGLTVVVIIKVLLPLVIAGYAPVPLAVIAATGVTVVTIGLTEGRRRSSVAAILGTAAALAVTGLLSAIATAVMGFTYTAGSDLGFLATQGGQGLDIRGVLLAAFILGAVGVLDDVTVTQAALVEELATKAGLRGRDLTASAMAIGRSHIAATVNTLFLAYAGAGLPLLVVLLVSQLPTALVVNDETIATEIVRTLVGSIGILTAVPLTTVIAVSLVGDGARTTSGWSTDARDSRLAIGAAAVGVAVLLGVTAAVSMLTTAPRLALVPDVFDPSASFPAAPGPTESPRTGEPPADEPVLLSVGEEIVLDVEGRPAATVVVTALRRSPRDSATHAVAMTAEYRATAPFDLDSARWEILLDDGSTVPFERTDGSTPSRATLAAGDVAALSLTAAIPAAATDPFVVYVDASTLSFVFALAVD